MINRVLKKSCIALVLVSFLCAFSIMINVISVKAEKLTDIGINKEYFGEETGFSEIVKTNGIHQFYNYEKGCVYVFNINGDIRAKWNIGGKNFNSPIAEKDGALTEAEAHAKAQFVDISSVGAVDKAITESAILAKLPAGTLFTDVSAKFVQKYTSLKAVGYNIGLPSSGVKIWDGYIFQDFCYGDSTANLFGDRGKRYTGLAYGVSTGDVYALYNGFAAQFERLNQDKSKLGDFISDSGKVVRVKGEDWTVQLFEGGYIRLGADNATTVNLGKKYDEEKQDFVNVFTFSNEYGAKVGDIIEISGGETSYQNFKNGYAKVTQVGGDFDYKYFANRNISADLQVTMVDKEFYLADAMSKKVEVDGNDSIGKIIPDLTPAKAEAVKTEFLSAVERSVTGSQYGIGLCVSNIKYWDNFIVLEFKDGDGKFKHDDSRQKMSIVVYNYQTSKAHVVGNYAHLWGYSTKNSIGNPSTDVQKNVTIKISGKDYTYLEFQEFDNGFICTNANGSINVELGYKYNSITKQYEPTAAPAVPSVFGKEIGRKSVGNNILINYEKASIEAELNLEGTRYNYIKYPGRNFNAENKPVLLPIDKLLKPADIRLDNTDFGIDKEVLRTLIYEKFTEYYDIGYFLGYLEDIVKPWNDIFAQQFIHGDSSANPFNDSRTNVCALAYNHNVSSTPGVGTVILLADTELEVWNKSFGILYLPKTSRIYYAEKGIYIQEFMSGLIITKGKVSYYSTKSLSKFLASYESNDKPSHNGSEKDGYINSSVDKIDKGCSSEMDGSLAPALLLPLVGLAIIATRKKKLETKV